jgi:hypothetical protein
VLRYAHVEQLTAGAQREAHRHQALMGLCSA